MNQVFGRPGEEHPIRYLFPCGYAALAGVSSCEKFRGTCTWVLLPGSLYLTSGFEKTGPGR